MRIVNLATFLSLPAGTVFNKYQPIVFEELLVKDQSIPETSDFFYSELSCPTGGLDTEETLVAIDAVEKGGSFQPDFDSLARDGCFDPDQLFAIWEPDDIRRLIAKLQASLPDNPK